MRVTQEGSDKWVEVPDQEKKEAQPPDPNAPAHEPPMGWADVLGPEVSNPPEARTEGRKLFEPDGTTHLVSPDENGIKGQFELWVQNNALKGIAQVEATGDIERADRMNSVYLADWGAGHYFWDGKHVRNARFTGMPGFTHLLWLLMVRCDPNKSEDEVGELMRKYPRQCGELMRWALGNCLAPVKKSGAEKRNGTVRTVKTVPEPESNVPRQRVVKSPATLD